MGKNGEEHKGLWHSLSFWDLKTPRHDLDETQRFNLTVLQGFCAARSHARDFFPIASYTGAGHKGTGWLNRQWSAVHRRSDSFFRIFCVVLSFHLNERVLRFTLHLLLCFWCRGEREEVSEEWANKGFTKLWDALKIVNVRQRLSTFVNIETPSYRQLLTQSSVTPWWTGSDFCKKMWRLPRD